MRNQRPAASILLMIAAAVFSLAAIELGLRVVLAWNPKSLEALAGRQLPPAGSELHLGDMIRLHSDPLLVYELIPGLQGQFLGHPLAINALGMRDRERTVEKPPGVFRILCLGDSHTFGWGVAQQDTYPARLEALLGRRLEGRSFEVWNLGVPGYNTVMEVEQFALLADRAQPDMVIINYVDNDMDLPNFLADRPDPWTLGRSYLLETTKRRLKILLGKGVFPPWLVGVDPDPDTGHFLSDPDLVPTRWRHLAGWEGMTAAYLRLARLARERGIPVVLLITWDDLRGRLAGTAENALPLRVRDLARRLSQEGYLVVDPQERIVRYLRERERPVSAVWLSTEDSHSNALRHHLVAEELLEAILQDTRITRAVPVL